MTFFAAGQSFKYEEAIALEEIEVATDILGMTVDMNTDNRGMRAVRLWRDD